MVPVAGMPITFVGGPRDGESLRLVSGDLPAVRDVEDRERLGPGHPERGPVLALLGHVLEEVPTLVPMSLTRLTVDIVRPLPVGEHLQVVTEILGKVKKIQLLDLVISARDTVTTRARALRIRDRDVTGLPVSTSGSNPAVSLPPPRSRATSPCSPRSGSTTWAATGTPSYPSAGSGSSSTASFPPTGEHPPRRWRHRSPEISPPSTT